LALYSGVWTLRFFVSLMILGFPGCQTILNFCLKSGVHFTLQENEGGWTPEVFFVPSRWVAEFVKPGWSRYMYFLPTTAKGLTLDRWDLVKGYLAGEKAAVDWANNWPEDKLVKWGTAS